MQFTYMYMYVCMYIDTNKSEFGYQGGRDRPGIAQQNAIQILCIIAYIYRYVYIGTNTTELQNQESNDCHEIAQHNRIYACMYVYRYIIT